VFVGLGDSIGEGVQSADANQQTQPFSFLNFIAWRMAAPFPIPLIETGVFGAVGSTDGRTRIDPSVETLNLAVSGADLHSLLFDPADAASEGEIDSETDLVLFPRVGSQIQIAEALQPQFAAVWIGSNDALSAALSFDQLDASQLTPLPQFTAEFVEIVQRLHATGAKVVFGTIPAVTGIAFLLNGDDLVRFLGSSYGLPAGSLTSVPAMILVKLGLAESTIFTDPAWILDPSEQQAVNDRIDEFNAVIRYVAAAYGMGVVDIHEVFDEFSVTPPVLGGLTLSTRFLGGLFSLDGVHPSNIGQLIVAYLFIEQLNAQHGAAIPQIPGSTFADVLLTDPFVDKDGDGRVTGRFGAGLLETVSSLLQISGDASDVYTSTAALESRSEGLAPNAAVEEAALNAYLLETGEDLRAMSFEDRVQAFHRLFGTDRLLRNRNHE
jgi:lysophospholipase L1-like esterase